MLNRCTIKKLLHIHLQYLQIGQISILDCLITITVDVQEEMVATTFRNVLLNKPCSQIILLYLYPLHDIKISRHHSYDNFIASTVKRG